VRTVLYNEYQATIANVFSADSFTNITIGVVPEYYPLELVIDLLHNKSFGIVDTCTHIVDPPALGEELVAICDTVVIGATVVVYSKDNVNSTILTLCEVAASTGEFIFRFTIFKFTVTVVGLFVCSRPYTQYPTRPAFSRLLNLTSIHQV
jgi:hypothetical protein